MSPERRCARSRPSSGTRRDGRGAVRHGTAPCAPTSPGPCANHDGAAQHLATRHIRRFVLIRSVFSDTTKHMLRAGRVDHGQGAVLHGVFYGCRLRLRRGHGRHPGVPGERCLWRPVPTHSASCLTLSLAGSVHVLRTVCRMKVRTTKNLFELRKVTWGQSLKGR